MVHSHDSGLPVLLHRAGGHHPSLLLTPAASGALGTAGWLHPFRSGCWERLPRAVLLPWGCAESGIHAVSTSLLL